MAPLVQIENLRKEFGSVRALDGVSFTVEEGEWIAIMGPSGSGKTTLINILGGLDSPTSGVAVVDGTDVARLDETGLTRFRAEKIGFIFQQFHLVSYLTALENVMLAQYFHSTTDEPQARAALVRVGLADRIEHLPSQLSGGEQQRVAIARAIVSQPDILIFDEPTASLDGDTGKAIVHFVRHEILTDKRCIVIVTHDARIYEYAHRILRMEDGQLKGVEDGDTSIGD